MNLDRIKSVLRMVWRPHPTRRGEGFHKLMAAIEHSHEESVITAQTLTGDRPAVQNEAHKAVVAIAERFEQ